MALLGTYTLLVAWIGLSLLWTPSVPLTMLEVQRTLVLVAWLAGILLLVRRADVTWFVGGVLLGVSGLCVDALAARAFQDVFGPPAPRFFDAGPLSGRVGYSNALGSLAALASLLALGLALRASRAVIRGAAAALLVLLVAGLYLTLSRGAWLGLALGVVVAFALDPARRSAVPGALALAPFAAGAAGAAALSPALVRVSPGSTAVSQGHRLALVLVVLASAAAAVAGLVVGRLPEVPARGTRLRRAGIAAGAVVVAVGIVAVLRVGGPAGAIEAAREAFTAPAARGGPTDRLLSASGTRRHHFWQAAWQGGRERPVAGIGAGTFELYWLEHRGIRTNVRDAHNLYLETFAELGAVGLALLIVALGLPVVAAVRARASPLVPATLGAYTVWLVHAGLDWMWEMTAVPVAALGCGAAIAAWARSDDAGRATPALARAAGIAATVALGTFAFVGLVGNSAVAASEEALYAGELDAAAEEATRARRWTPWASEPYRLLAETHLVEGDVAAAAAAARDGLERDPANWLLWYDLVLATRGDERRRAVEQLQRLNPRSFRVIALTERTN